tara:strand:+ start:11127 stop:11939 length:813 start_codon:yes stop_codon:yes gene_type:complete
MNIINELKSLLINLKNQFNDETPSIYEEKIISNKKEFVLDTDIYSQNRLIDIASRHHPDAKVISEELNNYHDLVNETENMLIMDPLDGTHNFLYGLPMWGFSYTLFKESRLAAESYIGLPMLDTLLSFENNKVLLHNIDPNVEAKHINLSPTNRPLSEMMISFDNQFNKDPITMKKNFDLLTQNAFTTRISGSAIFDIAMMIMGSLDARIWHSTEPYDVAPAYAFLSQSGSIINLNTGEDASVSDTAIIASTDKDIYKKLKSIGFQKGIH